METHVLCPETKVSILWKRVAGRISGWRNLNKLKINYINSVVQFTKNAVVSYIPENKYLASLDESKSTTV